MTTRIADYQGSNDVRKTGQMGKVLVKIRSVIK
jgi:hypothetical protein